MNMSYEYNKKYAEKYLGKLEGLTVRVPKGRKATVEALAAARGESEEEWKNAPEEQA